MERELLDVGSRNLSLEPSSPSRAVRILGTVALLGFSVVLSFLAAEALIRMLLPSFKPAYGYFEIDAQGRAFPFTLFVADPWIGWRRPPQAHVRYHTAEFTSEFRTNALGFRSSHEYDRGTRRHPVVALLGDSMTEGSQVGESDTFSSLLEGSLRVRLGVPVEVQNYGVSGFGFPHYLATYRHYARSRRPAIALICTFLGNDVSDSSPEMRTTSAPRPHYSLAQDGSIGDLLDFETPSLPPRQTSFWKRLLRENLATYRLLLWLRYGRLSSDRRIEPGDIDPVYQVYEDPWRPEWNEAWRYAAWSLSTLIREVRADGAQPLVVSIANRGTANASVWRELEDKYALLRPGYHLSSRAPERHVEELCDAVRVPFVDTTPLFRRAYEQGGPSPHFPIDGHLSAAGHALVAEALDAPVAQLLQANMAQTGVD
jgi:hypothetical protein